MIKHRKLWITAFILPCMLLFAVIYAIPIVTVFVTSFCRYTAFEAPSWTGLNNFLFLLKDTDFHDALWNTLCWVLLQCTLHVGIGLGMALILYKKPFGWKFVRTAYMIPNIIPTAATGVMFFMLLNPTFGLFKTLYEWLGWDINTVPNFFGDSNYSFFAVTITWIFYSAFNTIIFLAEISAIPRDIYESARVDGAKDWQIDWYITLPILKTAIGTCVILATVAMVSQFDIIYITTRGGPGTSTLNLPIYLYKTSTLESNYGMANAVGVIQIILGLSLVMLIRRIFKTDLEKKKGGAL